ncbi:DUF664 domain-containing protein [Streptomyces aureus]|uniref:mycothiol transferase n=1 Tax=Streptomyces aureus TaxID=193461 RepID=UPI0036A17797
MTAIRAVVDQSEADGRHVDLRWVILHLVEETSRHNGFDAVRELVHGRTGA